MLQMEVHDKIAKLDILISFGILFSYFLFFAGGGGGGGRCFLAYFLHFYKYTCGHVPSFLILLHEFG
ncbi:hypothetical protein ACJX0J_023788 [Zea mays]